MTEDITRLVMAALCGGLIGMERQLRGQTAGFRTQLIVCLGSCLFTIISLHVHQTYGNVADPGRIAAQVVVGIGFLGAGAILRTAESYVRGLTTAASMWVVSAVGMAVGYGEYTIAIAATSLIIVNLVFLKDIENIIPRDRYATVIIKLAGTDDPNFKAYLDKHNINLMGQRMRFNVRENSSLYTLSVKYRSHQGYCKFYEELRSIPHLIEIDLF